MYQQRNPIDQLKHALRTGDVLVIFITINVAVFLFIKLLETFLFLTKSNYVSPVEGLSGIAHLLAIPSSLPSLIIKPWTVLTYMFLHTDIWHILLNMLVLYFSGKMFLEVFSSSRFIKTYIWGGIAGAILFIVSFNFFPVFSGTLDKSVALGASASVMAILFGVAAKRPFLPVYLFPIPFFQIKLIYMAILFFILDIVSIPDGNAGGHIAHIGGALYGFLSVMVPINRFSLSRYFNRFRFNKSKQKRRYRTNTQNTGSRPASDDEYNLNKKLHQQRIDAILDKISKSGYSSLTSEEKELLFKNSSRN